MPDSAATFVIETYCQTHSLILRYLHKLSDEQLRWQLSAGSHSIAFHAWHLGRWADHLQASIPGMTPELGRRLRQGVQIWQAEGLATRWGFPSDQLGYAETGMGMADELALRLPFPAKPALLDYVERVFALAERNVCAIDEQQFLSAEQPQPLTEGIWGEATVGEAVLSHMTHDNRHLGMMECMLGLQGQPGTASQ